MRSTGYIAVAILGAIATAPSVARANSCNLYSPLRFGEIRTGCPVTIYAQPGIDPDLPEITRANQAVPPTVVRDQQTLTVTFEHYEDETSCTLIPSTEDRLFDRYVVMWPDLQPGDEIIVDGVPLTVPGPGDCGNPQPFFYCQDGVRDCDPIDDPNMPSNQGGCSAAGGDPSIAGAVIGVAALVRRRRRASR